MRAELLPPPRSVLVRVRRWIEAISRPFAYNMAEVVHELGTVTADMTGMMVY